MFHLKELFLAAGFAALAASGASCRNVGGAADSGADSDADSDVDSDADTDTDVDSDADTDSPPACPAPIGDGCDGWSAAPLPLLVTAEELGVDRFVGVAHSVLLAARFPPSDTTGNDGIAAFFGDPTTYPEIVWEPVEIQELVAALHPISITAGDFANGPYGVTVLFCDEDEHYCGVMSAVQGEWSNTTAFEVLPEGEVPTAGELRGATCFDDFPSAWSGTICVYGDGIFCFDGDAWTTEIAPGTGPLFNDLECDRNRDNECTSFAAVGDGGRFARRGADAEDAWIDGFADTSEDLLVLSGAGLVAGGTDGVILSDDLTCTVSSSPIVGLFGRWFDLPPEEMPDAPEVTPIVGVTENRQHFMGNAFGGGDPHFSNLCPIPLEPEDPGVGAAISVGYFFCGLSANRLVLTEPALYGTLECGVD